MVEEQRQIVLREEALRFTLKRSARARMLRMTVYPGGAFVVTAPASISDTKIFQSIRDRSAWLLRVLQRLRDLSPLMLRGGRREYLQNKALALELAHKRLAHFNRLYKYTYGRVTIRNQKTRWGSCSKAGNLNFSYKIALLPEHLADYVIVHELCHTAHFNHGRAFWVDVAKAIPNPKACRTQLRTGKFESAML